MAAARALTITSGPVGFAETNSRRMRRPRAASLLPEWSPAARISRSAFAHHAGARKTLRNPGAATSSRSTSGSDGKCLTISSAICRGGFFAERASVMAAFVA